MDDAVSLDVACGQLLFVGFDGTTLPSELTDALSKGHRGGVILFKRNIAANVLDVAHLNASIVAAAPRELPPILGVDQEGGRVKRLGPPVLQVPPMRSLAEPPDADVVERVAHAVGLELAALGFTMSFAPVLDVDSNPNNPIIGDRSFSRDPAEVARLGIAYARGLGRAGILACGKHYPGHGDTEEDSHLSLPRVRHDRARIEALELAPFRAAFSVLPSIMTAHVVFDALDPENPATLSRAVMSMLRSEFEGVIISDDLFMRGVSPSGGADVREIADAAVRAIDAGCDMLLVCHAGPAAAAAHQALLARASNDEAFAGKVRASFARIQKMRIVPRPITDREELTRRINHDLAVVCGC